MVAEVDQSDAPNRPVGARMRNYQFTLSENRNGNDRSMGRPGREERQVKPWYVHDGLEFVLTELTGFSMGPQNGHLLQTQREQNTRKWVAWCVGRFPEKADACRSGER